MRQTVNVYVQNDDCNAKIINPTKIANGQTSIVTRKRPSIYRNNTYHLTLCSNDLNIRQHHVMYSFNRSKSLLWKKNVKLE